MIRFIFILLFSIYGIFSHPLKYQAEEVVIIIRTTSISSAWSPQTVIKTGKPLTWKATATGMADQITTTSGAPIFDLSEPRTSDVTITITSTDGASGLTELRLVSLNLISIDLRNATGLEKLNCSDNQLRELDISGNTKLVDLNCHSNFKIKELILRSNVLLRSLTCFYNELTDLDLSQNRDLTTLSCSFNLIKELNLTQNISLTSLECNNNKLEFLNVQNGNNENINIFNSTNNINLYCIQVDDETSDFSGWNKDDWSEFNNDCTFSNRPPVAYEDIYDTNDNTTLIVDAENGVLVNDSDHEENPLTAISVTDVSNGNLQLNPDGSFTYTPAPFFYGEDQFTYKANDGELDSSPVKVTIQVVLKNELPVAVDDFYEVTENIGLTIDQSRGVLTNDTDADGDMLFADLEDDVHHGVLDLVSDGSFTYLPDVDFYGEDFFTYRAFDGYGFSSIVNVSIAILAIQKIIVPDAFSPNNDRVNDTFKPVYKGMNRVRLEIYDTWGNLIFVEEGKVLVGWDGTLKGKEAENGNYRYKIKALTHEDKVVDLDGILTLIK